jgi:DNA primase
MELTIQEVNYYNDLVKNDKATRIECMFGADDTVVSKVDSSDKVFFYCLGCQSSFYPGINLIQKIKGYISLSTS